MRHLRILWLGAAVMLTACQGLNDAPAGSQQASLLPPDQASAHVIAAAPPAAHVAAPVAGSLSAPPAPIRAAGTDEAIKPFDFAGTSGGIGPAVCRFDGLQLPPGTKVYAAGGYGGAAQSFQIDQSGHQATRMDVAVNQPSAPVVLMLGSYEPTVWNVGWSPGTRILAVLVSGYHRQVINGLPSGVPRIVSTHDNHGACPSFSLSGDRFDSLNSAARLVFGRNVDMVFAARSGKVLVSESGAEAGRLVTDRAAQAAESFRLADAPLAGEAGLEEAVRKGYLREATPADARDWQMAAAAARGPGDVPPVYGGTKPRPIAMYHAYVVQKPFTLPAGLYGAHSATFFVPKGLPRPKGTLGHSTLYDFNTLSCAGVACWH
ncbi:hypothetical protein [Dyella sp.]|uniref:hypothetical protein n=1 Tax=Dyella sp. TaxID=1869338 RepID=UPI003F7D7802